MEPAGAADFEAVRFVEDDRNVAADGPQVDRPAMVRCCADRLACFPRVSGAENRHVGHAAHHGDVFDRLVRRAGLARGDAAVGAIQLDVGLRISNRDADLINGPLGQEYGKRGYPRDKAQRAHPRRHADHVLLGDAGLDKPFGIGIAEPRGVAAGSYVGVEDDQRGVLRAEFQQRVGEGSTHFDQLT